MKTNNLPAPTLRVARLVALLTAAALSLSACRDQEKESLPDPCKGQKANPLTLTFTEAFGTPTPDTAYNDQPMAFEGPEKPYTSYQWLIGPVDERTGRRIGVSFDDQTLGSIPVRLIATRPPNLACFPKDDGVDTLTKTLTLVPNDDLRAPIYGKFQGANLDAPADTFSVRIYSGPDWQFPDSPKPLDYLVGIPKGCRVPYRNIGITWRGVRATSGGCSSIPINKGYLTTRDSIRLEYRAEVSPTIIDRVFVGKRVR
ncbi:hypothetical protein GCM10022408_18450 [Hymenobacter fastidiosus]|uniref:Lipoprotein n=1 Tax=Hymenobacter fastidiosus TaxID=486264 RepID=A0ABP7S5B2_9BACT